MMKVRHKRPHHDSIYMKCQEQINPQREKVNQWLSGAGAGETNGVWRLNGYGVSRNMKCSGIKQW